jgi:peptidoglycan/LPS O-acetylase OafA/YrhL
MNVRLNPGATAGALPIGSVGPASNLRGHLPALDGLRGLAVSMVLVFHFVGQMLPTNALERAIVGVTKHGLLGVDLFFVLSGFLITGLLYEAHDKPHYLRNFYMRRVLRIFPLYYGVLALVFFVAPLIPPLRGPTLDYLLDRQAWAWLYGINVYLAGHEEWSFSYLNHFWSLAVEEHFYLFWPFLVLLLARRPRALIAVSLAISLGAMLARVTGILLGLSWWTTVVLTPFKLDDHGAAARGPRLAGAGSTESRSRGRRARGGQLRLDRSGVAPGAGGGGIHPGGAVPDIAGLHAAGGSDRAEAVDHLAPLLQPRHGLPGHLQLRPVCLPPLHLVLPDQ